MNTRSSTSSPSMTAKVSNSHRCSGSLITDTVVVTAAHCTDGMTSARSRFGVEITGLFRWGWVAPSEHRTPVEWVFDRRLTRWDVHAPI